MFNDGQLSNESENDIRYDFYCTSAVGESVIISDIIYIRLIIVLFTDFDTIYSLDAAYDSKLFKFAADNHP